MNGKRYQSYLHKELELVQDVVQLALVEVEAGRLEVGVPALQGRVRHQHLVRQTSQLPCCQRWLQQTLSKHLRAALLHERKRNWSLI